MYNKNNTANLQSFKNKYKYKIVQYKKISLLNIISQAAGKVVSQLATEHQRMFHERLATAEYSILKICCHLARS